MNLEQKAQAVAVARLLGYARLNWPEFKIGAHHQLIADALQRVESGECKRLIITMPPRHGKTQLASRYFPAWYLGRNPDRYVIAATYAQEFADDIGRDVRNIMQDDRHLWAFPQSRLRDDSTSAKRFQTSQGGAYFAVGAGGSITGRGAHLLLIDDPIKGREEADSVVMRRKLKDWYTSVAYTRLMPGGAIVVIQTRWHEEDLAGWLIAEHAHENWEVLSLPAIDDTGAALWPEQYPIEDLQRIKQALTANGKLRDWTALYQQNPVPDEGIQFKHEWFKRYRLGQEPSRCRYYMSSDFAVTPDSGDYTEHAVWAVGHDGNLYAVDWWYGQASPDQWIESGLDLVKKHKPLFWVAESGVIRRAVEPFLIKRMKERQIFCNMRWTASIADKPTRARAFEARASMGMVHLPYSDWADRTLGQLVRFPAGKNDDAVDACSILALELDTIMDGAAPPKPKKKQQFVEEYTFDAIVAASEHSRAARMGF